MSLFPTTSHTLIQKLAAEVSGESEESWERFFNLYTPAIRRLVEWSDRSHDPDDVVQEVYLKLVEVIRAGRYDSSRMRFRTFLAMIIRHQLISLYRHDQVRKVEARVPIDDLTEELTVPANQPDEIDKNWARAKHEAAVEHVLTKVAMKVETRQIYRAYALEGRPVDEIAAKFGVSPGIIYKVKYRVDKIIEALEEEYAEEKI